MFANVEHYFYSITSPIGILTIAGTNDYITGLWIEGQKYFKNSFNPNSKELLLPIFKETKSWLNIFFAGEMPNFIPPLNPMGTIFQCSVWELLNDIPYGKMTTYGEIARLLEIKTKKRVSPISIGAAISRNPISILIPCHRVIGKCGDLCGYAGGLPIKKKLLELEQCVNIQ